MAGETKSIAGKAMVARLAAQVLEDFTSQGALWCHVPKGGFEQQLLLRMLKNGCREIGATAERSDVLDQPLLEKEAAGLRAQHIVAAWAWLECAVTRLWSLDLHAQLCQANVSAIRQIFSTVIASDLQKLKATAQTQAETDIERLQMMIKMSRDAIFILSWEGKIESFNDAAKKIWSILDRQTGGPVGFPGLFALEHCLAIQRALGHVKNGLNTDINLSINAPVNKEINVKFVVANHIWQSGKKLIAIVRDLTDDCEIRQKHEYLAVQERLANEKRANFLATLVQDLRSPMTAAKTAAEAILCEPEEHHKHQTLARSAEAQVNLADDIITDLLDVNRLRSRAPEALSFSNFDIVKVLQQITQECSAAYRKDFTLVVKAEKVKGLNASDALIYSSTSCVRRIFRALFTNAIKSGAVHSEICSTLDIDLERVSLIISNKDTSAPHDGRLPLCDTLGSRQAMPVCGDEGSDPGLSLAHILIERLGGNVAFNRDNIGSVMFCVTLPRTIPQETQSALLHKSQGDGCGLVVRDRAPQKLQKGWSKGYEQSWLIGLIAAIRSSVIMVSAKKNIILFNERAEWLLGVGPKQAVGKKIDDVVCLVDGHGNLSGRDAIDQAISEKKNVSLQHGQYVRKRDGRSVAVAGRVSVVLDAHGDVVGLILSIRDLDLEMSLAKKEQILAQVFENSQDFMAVATPDMQVHYVNAAGRALVGIDPNDNRIRPIADFYGPEARTRVLREILPQQVREGTYTGYAVLCNFKTRERINVHRQAFALKDQKTGNLIAYTTRMRDLRPQVISERAQQKEQLHLIRSFDAVGIGLWELNLSTMTFRICSSIRRMLGLLAKPSEVKVTDLLACVVSSDKQRIRDVFHAVSIVPKTIDLTFRIVDAKKKKRTIHLMGEVASVVAGLEPSIVGTCEDETQDSKRIDALNIQILQSEIEGRVFVTLFEQIPFMFGVFKGIDLRLQYANRALTIWLGAEPCLGKPLVAFSIGDNQKIRGAIQKILQSGETEALKAVLVQTEGKEAWFDIAFAPLRDAHGVIEGFSTILIDVTEYTYDKRDVDACAHQHSLLLTSAAQKLCKPLNNLRGQLRQAEKAFSNKPEPSMMREESQDFFGQAWRSYEQLRVTVEDILEAYRA